MPRTNEGQSRGGKRENVRAKEETPFQGTFEPKSPARSPTVATREKSTERPPQRSCQQTTRKNAVIHPRRTKRKTRSERTRKPRARSPSGANTQNRTFQECCGTPQRYHACCRCVPEHQNGGAGRADESRELEERHSEKKKHGRETPTCKLYLRKAARSMS